ncbi:MAG: glutathione peroxidase [Hyphomicrobiaceae bacterium]
MRRLLLAPLVAILLLVTHSGAWAQMTTSAYDFEFEAIEGGKLPLAQWRNKALLIVNVASFCGFTPQYEGLQALWQRYEARGLVVVGVPSNDFGAQEPKSESEILGYCQGAFGVNFPMTTKQVVSGGQAHPFYLWARDTLGLTSTPRWNFHKYLVGRDGKLIGGFGSSVTPLSDTMINAIEMALGAS